MKKDQLIYGVHPVLEAIESGKSLDKVMLQKGLNAGTSNKLIAGLKGAGVPFQFVPKIKLDKLPGKNHQGVIGFISPVEFQQLEWLLPSIYEEGQVPLILILDRISDVRNFGAICRTAESAGVHAIVIPAKGAAQLNEDALKTSTGSLLRIPVCRSASLTSTLAYLKESGLRVVACHEKAANDYTKPELTSPVAIVMGSEDDGISPKIIHLADDGARIPLQGQVSSLNVSVATAIMLFEAVRQRGLKG